MSEQPTPESETPISDTEDGLDLNGVPIHKGWIRISKVREIEYSLSTAQSSNQQLTEDLERERQGNDSIKAQVDGLRAERDEWKKTEHGIRVSVQAGDRDLETEVSQSVHKGFDLQREVFALEKERDALAAQVATLTAERDEALAIVHQYGGFHSRTPREMEIEAALNQTFPTDWSSEDNTISELLVLIEAGRGRLWQAANERDQLRTQNAELIADGVVLRGVMESMQWLRATHPHLWPEKATLALATTSPGAPLIETVRRAVEALRVASQTFAKYTKIHADKMTDEGHEKAIANHLFYSQMEQALAELEKFIPKP